MIGAQNSLNLNCKVRVIKEAPGPSVSEEIADIFRNYNIDNDDNITGSGGIYFTWVAASYKEEAMGNWINASARDVP